MHGANRTGRPFTGDYAGILLYQTLYEAGLATGPASLSAADPLRLLNTRIVNSTLLYDVILVVVLGGISLSGGKGGVRNVIVGTLLIGTLLNAFTILDVNSEVQNIIKGVVLLAAIVLDNWLHPRDEETARQGD